MSCFAEATAKICSFRDERDRARFHHPKDMAIAISPEAGDLLERFLRKDTGEVESRVRTHGAGTPNDIADIAIYLAELADNHGVDLLRAMEEKLEKNALKHPVSLARGRSRKHAELREGNRLPGS